ncbi:hypothetical protein Patl1_07779 [Pistacia atlantica]|uniref:Uncharacterized protein n=1 Tax=Pistacia atlantica TaxID=434234 RepID=A0ACC1AE31_9ROSI|nr:hypothetical protein Patl1_07779 [Pistacia atlantica]
MKNNNNNYCFETSITHLCICILSPTNFGNGELTTAAVRNTNQTNKIKPVIFNQTQINHSSC